MGLRAWFRQLHQQPDRYRWYALGLTTLSQAAVTTLSFSFGPVAPFLQNDFQISRAEIGLISAAMSLTGAPSALFGGRAADLIGERRILIVSGLVTALAAFTISWSVGYWSLLVSCLALGLGNGLQNPAGSAAVMRWFPPRQRGVAMGVRQTGVPLGGVLAASAAPVLALTYGWRSVYTAGALTALVGALLLAVAYYDPPRVNQAEAASPRSFQDLSRDSQLWWISLIFNCQLLAQTSATTYFVLFLHEALAMPVVGAATLFAVINGVAMIGRIGWGLLSDRQFRGRRRPVLVIIVLLTISASLIATLLSSRSPVVFAVGLAVLLGAATFSWTGVLGTLIIETVGRESAGSAISLVQVFATPASLLGPPLFGFLADHSGSYRVAWFALTLVGLLGLFAVFKVQEEGPETKP
jgi:predicted MFS family arabinose efflux permease